MFNIKRNKQKQHFAKILEKGNKEELRKKPLPKVDDVFKEQSTGVIAQLRKTPFFRLADFLEMQRTSFKKESLFVLEILNDKVNIAIVSRKGLFLDINLIKTYTYENLYKIYQEIVVDTDVSVGDIIGSVENIVSIIAYDIVFSLPSKVVIVGENFGQLKEIRISAGRFNDELNLENIMLRELMLETGYSTSEIIYSAIKKPLKNQDKASAFLVSLCDKEVFNSVDEFLKEAKFSLKKLHSIQSSIYASFPTNPKFYIARLHIANEKVYMLEKNKTEAFEFHEFNINESYDDILALCLVMDEVILSGSGENYEKIKKGFKSENVNIRCWNYNYDLKRCIIRLEKDMKLTNEFANLISTAYYELFNVRFAVLRLGVGTKLSAYEHIALNLNLFPIAIVLLSIIGVAFWYVHVNNINKVLKVEDENYGKVYKEETKLKNDVKRFKDNIKKIDDKLVKFENIMKSKNEIKDAKILFEIANSLPYDVILTNIKKFSKQIAKNKQAEIISIDGKCYLEKSMFDFIEKLKIDDKKVYLVKIKDSEKVRFLTQEEKDLNNMLKVQQNEDSNSTLLNEAENVKLVQKVYYTDTLNNSFTLEIK